MAITESIETEIGSVTVSCSTVSDGDFALATTESGLEGRRQTLLPGQWTWLQQVHGSNVVLVNQPGQHAGEFADGAVTFAAGNPIAVLTADCAPVALVGSHGLAVLHCGWRGIASGVIARAAAMLASANAVPLRVVLGPCIRPQNYEFGLGDLEILSAQFGDSVVGQTRSGQPALDMPALVDSACDLAGWPAARPLGDVARCTSEPAFFSHRTRADIGRQTMVGCIADA